jgi:predicted transcriptional regulator
MGSDEPLRTIGVKLPHSKKERFEEILRGRGTNPSVFLRQAIYDFLDRVDSNEEDQLSLHLDTKK